MTLSDLEGHSRSLGNSRSFVLATFDVHTFEQFLRVTVGFGLCLLHVLGLAEAIPFVLE